MNLNDCKQLDNFLPATYIKQATDAAKSRENLIHQLIQHVNIPWKIVSQKCTAIIFRKKYPLKDGMNIP